MRGVKFYLCIVFCHNLLLFTFVFSIYAEPAPLFKDSYAGAEIGARARSMGSAFVAVAGDPSTFYWNCASMARLKVSCIALGYERKACAGTDFLNLIKESNRLSTDQLTYLSLIGTEGVTEGVGLSWRPLSNFHQKNLYTMDVTGGDTTEEWMNLEYEINEYIYTGAKPIVEEWGSFLLGLNLKYLHGKLSYTKKIKKNGVPQEPELDVSTGHGFGIDLGLLIEVTDYLDMGLMVRNLLSAMYWEGYDQDWIFPDIALGAAAKFANCFLISPSVEKKFEGDKPIMYRLGAKFQPFAIGQSEKRQISQVPERPESEHLSLYDIILLPLSVRGGVSSDDLSNADRTTYTCGLGYNFKNYSVDLALVGENIEKFKTGRYEFSYSCSISIPLCPMYE